MAAFPEVERIRYEGPESKNPLAFRYYNGDEKVAGKTMRDHLRFSVVYWHSFRNPLSDPFGPGTAVRPWEDGTDSVENAKNRVRVAFEFMEKLGSPFYAFHDRDVAPEGSNLTETNRNLDAVVKVLKEEQQRTGIKLLWGTANLFSNRRYMHGAATSPNADAFAFAAAHTGEKSVGGDQGARRRRVHFLGRPRRIPEFVEHEYEAGAGSPGPLPAHGGRLRQRDRVHWPVLY
jgi:xylose isomerase